MGAFPNIASFTEIFRANPLASTIFRAIQRASAISGWALAKQTNIQPDVLEKLLSELQVIGLIRSDGPGLDGYFSLTDLGFQYDSFAA